MSKTIAELYEEMAASEELQQEYLATAQEGEDAILAFAAAHDCEATAEEVREFLEEKAADEGELSLNDLDHVAGGGDQHKGKKELDIQINTLDIKFDENGAVTCHIDGKSVSVDSVKRPS